MLCTKTRFNSVKEKPEKQIGPDSRRNGIARFVSKESEEPAHGNPRRLGNWIEKKEISWGSPPGIPKTKLQIYFALRTTKGTHAEIEKDEEEAETRKIKKKEEEEEEEEAKKTHESKN